MRETKERERAALPALGLAPNASLPWFEALESTLLLDIELQGVRSVFSAEISKSFSAFANRIKARSALSLTPWSQVAFDIE